MAFGKDSFIYYCFSRLDVDWSSQEEVWELEGRGKGVGHGKGVGQSRATRCALRRTTRTYCNVCLARDGKFYKVPALFLILDSVDIS